MPPWGKYRSAFPSTQFILHKVVIDLVLLVVIVILKLVILLGIQCSSQAGEWQFTLVDGGGVDGGL
jgi:hypothetical protein